MSKPLPLVLQLQADAIDPQIPVSKLLRTAKAIATKLGQKGALEWINGELNGYMSALTKDLPDYRIISGQPKAFNPVRLASHPVRRRRDSQAILDGADRAVDRIA